MKKLTSKQCLTCCIVSIIIGAIFLIFGKNNSVKNLIYVFSVIATFFLINWYAKEKQANNEQLQGEFTQFIEKAEGCAASADNTDNLRDFIYYWDRMIGFVQKAMEYEVPLSLKKNINFELDDLKAQEQKHIRDALKREYHYIVGKHIYNDSLFEVYYKIFCDEIEEFSNRFDVASLKVANDYKTKLQTKLPNHNQLMQEPIAEPEQKQTPKSLELRAIDNVLTEDELTDYELLEVDLMSNEGWKFEEYIAKLLLFNGFSSAETTSKSNDYGADVIAISNDSVKYAIQCKCYSEPVGNKAVQEIVAGMKFYNCHVGVVFTNNYFTNNAIELAKMNGIILWDRNKLQEMIKNKILQNQLPNNSSANSTDMISPEEDDPLLKDAIAIFIDLGKISPSMLQRRLGVGFSRANRLIRQMEDKGIISSTNGSRPREVLVSNTDVIDI